MTSLLRTTLVMISIVFGLFTVSVFAEQTHRPYVLTSYSEGNLENSLDNIKEKLRSNGFETVGEYWVDTNSVVLAITSAELKAIAAMTEFGGYGAAQRVALTHRNGKIQVSYTNPVYMGSMYRMNDLSSVYQHLKSVLGFEKEFGSEEGMTPAAMRDYHYMVMMPYFDDHNELAEYTSHSEAVSAVEKGLESGNHGAGKIYRIDLPGKEETVFGVSITRGDGADLTVLQNCDKNELSHTAYLPYEILVSEGKIYAHDGKFRIALSFPDLAMSTFMVISGAPGDIEDILEAVAENK